MFMNKVLIWTDEERTKSMWFKIMIRRDETIKSFHKKIEQFYPDASIVLPNELSRIK